MGIKLWCCLQVRAGSPEDALKPLSNSEYLSLRVNPNGMQPLIIASFLIFSIPGILSLVAPPAAAAFMRFQRSGYFLVFYFLTVIGSNFAGVGETPKNLSKYLISVRPSTPPSEPTPLSL